MSTKPNSGRFLVELHGVDQPVFCPGQYVSGSVIFWNEKPETFEAFYVKVKGVGKVSWSTGSGDDRSTYTAIEKYCNIKIPLLGQPLEHQYLTTRDENVMGLAPGRHQFPFAFVLPLNIPSSYSFQTGYVRYNLIAKMKKSGLNRNRIAEVRLTIQDNVDLNGIEAAMIAPIASVVKQASFLHPGMIKVDAWLDRAGYTPGETINLNAKIERTTGKTVKKIKIRLVQHTTFVAKSARDRMVKEVYKFSQEWSRNSDSEEAAVIQFSIVVPNVPASGKPFCSIVEIFYELEFIVDYSRTSSNAVAKLGIIIGNIPLQSIPSVINYPEPQFEPQIRTNGGNPPDSPPPSYDEKV